MNQADENASVVNISGGCQSKPCIPVVAWTMRPNRKQEHKERCTTFKQPNFLSISSEICFQMWNITSTPNSCFLKHIYGAASDCLARADHSPRRSRSIFTVGLKLVTLCVANDKVYFWQQCDTRKHYLILLPG